MPSAMSSEESLDRALHAISDPTRRRILEALKDALQERGPAANAPQKTTISRRRCLCAGDVEERVGLSQPTISHHMAILVKAGLVEATKQGQWRWYRRKEKAIREMVKTLRKRL
jgi:DNA-binding transcriptional ArsR family regulator